MELPSLATEDKKIKENPKYKVVQSVLRKSHIKNVTVNQNAMNKMPFKFNHSLPENTVATNQQYSGRCWIFAGLNVIRHKMIARYKLAPDFELSQSYLFRCDKLEKCNTALELFYSLAKDGKDNSSLEYSVLIGNSLSDGGTVQEFVKLVKKYGVVPKENFQEIMSSKHTGMLNELIKITINKATNVIHKDMSRSDFEKYKASIMNECNRIITLTLGNVPSRFVWTVKETNVSKEHTPHSFYKSIVRPVINIENYVCISNDPRNRYNSLLCVEDVHNILDNNDTDLKRKLTNLYLNVDIKTMKDAVFQTITKHKTPTWFATDYGTFVLNDGTILDQKSSTMSDMFDVDFVHDKKLSMQARITVPNHAMCLIGCQKEKGEYKRWKVENSHGTGNSLNGFLNMSDAFFENYIVCAFVHKSTLRKELRDMFYKHNNITWLPFWDVLGIYA